MFDTIVQGSRRVLERAAHDHATVLLIELGRLRAPPPNLEHVGEDYRGAPDPLDLDQVYAEGKRASELLGVQARESGLEVKIARLFAFVGPYLPLDRHFTTSPRASSRTGSGTSLW